MASTALNISVPAELLWKTGLLSVFLGDRNPDLPFTPTWFSVHRLKPADIKVIAALGDSLTVRSPDCGGKGKEQEGPGLGSWDDLERKPHSWFLSVSISGPDCQSLYIPARRGTPHSLPTGFSHLHPTLTLLLSTLGRRESRKWGDPGGSICGGSDLAQVVQWSWTRSPTCGVAAPQRPGALSVHVAKLREGQRDDETGAVLMGGVGSVGERPLSAASPRDTQALQSAIPEKPAQVLPESA